MSCSLAMCVLLISTNFKRAKISEGGKIHYYIYTKEAGLVSQYNPLDKTYVENVRAGGVSIARLNSKKDLNVSSGLKAKGSSASGNIVWERNFTPFGKEINNNDIDSSKDSLNYTGHIKDSTGLLYMQARYYDPVIGRFYSNDPVGYVARNPVHSFNRYSYVSNNPYKYTDPDGQEIQFIGSSYSQFKEAYRYIATNSPTGKRILNNALSKKTPVIELSLTDGDTTMTTASSDENAKIKWNPKEGLKTDSGSQTPATGLVHEVIHAQNPELSENLTVNKENQVNKETGEGTRNSHSDGKVETVSGPTCRSTSEGETCG